MDHEAIAKGDALDRRAVIRACAELPRFDPQGEHVQPAVALCEIKSGRFELVEVLR